MAGMFPESERRIVAALIERNSGEFRCGCTVRDIADTTGLGRDTVEVALPYLIGERRVVAGRAGQYSPPLYRLRHA